MDQTVKKKRWAGYWLAPLGVALIFWIVDAALDSWLLHLPLFSEPNFTVRYELAERTLVALLLAFTTFLITKRIQDAKQRVEARFEKQQTKAIASDRMRALGEMGASLAHTLNQPLTGIRGMAEHLELGLERQWGIEPEKMREKLVRIREQADRITNIVDHVRTFAKEAETPAAREVSLNDIIHASAEIFTAQLHYHSIRLNLDLEDNLPKVLANPYSLEEIILALVANSRDSFQELDLAPGPADEPATIVVKTRANKIGDTPWVELEIIDNGCGMTEEQAAHAFELFFSTKDTDKGTGLGLSVSKSIIEQFGGRIDLQTAVGNGTTVRVQLPPSQSNPKQPGAQS